jgi:2',3'-cyclic-nucleotide 2'-phosphodiesterase (5'-nucleotidase family)
MAFLVNKIQSMSKKPNTPVHVFGGHSHERKFKVYSTSSTGLQSGKYGDTVGWLAMNGIESKTYTGAKQPARVPHPSTPAKPKNQHSTIGDAFDTKKRVQSLENPVLYARRYLDFNRESFQFHTDTGK